MNFVIVKLALELTPPIFFTGVRYALAGAILLPFVVQGVIVCFRRGLLPRLILLAVLNAPSSMWLTLGLQYVSPAESAMLYYTMPLWTVVLAALVLGEKLTVLRVSGVVLGFLGIFVFFILGTASPLSLGLGALITITGAVSWATGTVLFRKLMKDTKPLPATTIQFLIGAAVITMLSFPLENNSSVVLNSDYFVYLIYAGPISTGLAFGYIWFRLLSRLEASTLSAFSFLTPLFAVFSSFLVTGEIINQVQIAGSILVFIGIYLANKTLQPTRRNVLRKPWQQEMT